MDLLTTINRPDLGLSTAMYRPDMGLFTTMKICYHHYLQTNRTMDNSKNQIPTDNRGNPISDCIRCGKCCSKGGPAFHLQDRELLEKGAIHSRDIYTIRKGEPAHDNVKGGLFPVSTDIIKIKGQEDSWACIFLEMDGNTSRCR
ncbi:MAG: hypothetical protein GY866_29075, partial [Proteobacteria bacterium]|nr:hypothetical protein [Pseudomonadota bacterium]